jgi:hypothetical protein
MSASRVDPSDWEYSLDHLESGLADQLANTLLEGVDFDDFDW